MEKSATEELALKITKIMGLDEGLSKIQGKKISELTEQEIDFIVKYNHLVASIKIVSPEELMNCCYEIEYLRDKETGKLNEKIQSLNKDIDHYGAKISELEKQIKESKAEAEKPIKYNNLMDKLENNLKPLCSSEVYSKIESIVKITLDIE